MDNKQTILTALEAIVLLQEYFDTDEEILIWLQTPNKNFNNIAPVELILTGKSDIIEEHLKNKVNN